MRMGIDLGGTKIEGILLDATGHEVLRRRIPAPRDDYAATLAAVAGLVADLDARAGTANPLPGPLPVGVGIPGTLSPATGVVKNANSTWLIGHPLDHDLAAALGRPVRLANDANCFAVSEAVDGAGTGHRVVFGVILGTGVGGGIAIDGRPLTGPNAVAGEWGHIPLPWPRDDDHPAPPCYCGLTGCIETFLCGPAVIEQYRAAGGTAPNVETIAERAAAGEPLARRVLDRHAHRLARGLALVINLLDPDVIVLGGGLSNLPGLYDRVPELWADWVFSDRVDTPLVRARHGDSSGVRGAAWLWPPGARAGDSGQ